MFIRMPNQPVLPHMPPSPVGGSGGFNRMPPSPVGGGFPRMPPVQGGNGFPRMPWTPVFQQLFGTVNTGLTFGNPIPGSIDVFANRSTNSPVVALGGHSGNFEAAATGAPVATGYGNLASLFRHSYYGIFDSSLD